MRLFKFKLEFEFCYNIVLSFVFSSKEDIDNLNGLLIFKILNHDFTLLRCVNKLLMTFKIDSLS